MKYLIMHWFDFLYLMHLFVVSWDTNNFMHIPNFLIIHRVYLWGKKICRLHPCILFVLSRSVIWVSIWKQFLVCISWFIIVSIIQFCTIIHCSSPLLMSKCIEIFSHFMKYNKTSKRRTWSIHLFTGRVNIKSPCHKEKIWSPREIAMCFLTA